MVVGSRTSEETFVVRVEPADERRETLRPSMMLGR